MPCRIELLKVSNLKLTFYEFDEYTRLVQAAQQIGARSAVVVLLGGDAGLRRGEMVALRWCNVDFVRRQLRIEEAAWRQIVGTPKGGRGRVVPMTSALMTALQQYRQERGEPAPADRVLYDDDGRAVRDQNLRDYHKAVQQRAGVPYGTGALHILRHTFCSHLAMTGAPVKANQELAGHKELTTTMRYMHLSPAVRESAIRMLEARSSGGAASRIFGDIVEKVHAIA
jgi:integrase